MNNAVLTSRASFSTGKRPCFHLYDSNMANLFALLLCTLQGVIWFCPSGTLSTSSGFYADNGVDQTVIYRFLPKRERKEMQQEILNLLGLHHRPKPRTHGTENSAPKYLIDLYKSFLDEESGNLKIDEAKTKQLESGILSNNSIHAINDSDVIMSFINRIHHHAPHIRHDRDRRFWFDVSEVSPEENIMGAELRLYRDLEHNRLPNNLTYTLTLFSLAQGDDPEDRILHLIASLHLSHHEDGWLALNVTEPMISWVSFPHENLGLFLRIKASGMEREIEPSEIGLVGSKGPDDRQPFMVAFFKTPTSLHVRRTRSTTPARIKKQSRSDVSYYDQEAWNPYANPADRFPARSCQKRNLYVSFRDLGWQDWIIAPEGYAAFYCHGECSFPLNSHMNATNHAIVQTLVHLMNPLSSPKPCCAATKLSSIMVLYFDDNSNVILKKYKNMVVKSCGCQ